MNETCSVSLTYVIHKIEGCDISFKLQLDGTYKFFLWELELLSTVAPLLSRNFAKISHF